MTESRNSVAYLVFDVEAVADGEIIANVRYDDEGLTNDEAIARYRADLLEQTGRDVIPPTFMQPISVAVAKVDANYRLIDVAVLDAPRYRPSVICQKFWDGWHHYNRPTFVTFNGRGYDLPVMEISAFRNGLSLPDWFDVYGRSYNQPRNRYNVQSHIDLMDLFSNFGATRIVGGLNLMANLIGKPGKTGIDGSKIQQMHDDGRVEEINDYCRCDVLDTYFVFLRSRVLVGELSLEREQEVVAAAKQWLVDRRESSPAYEHYLTHWGDWEQPELEEQASAEG